MTYYADTSDCSTWQTQLLQHHTKQKPLGLASEIKTAIAYSLSRAGKDILPYWISRLQHGARNEAERAFSLISEHFRRRPIAQRHL